MLGDNLDEKQKGNKIWILTIILFVLTYVVVFVIEPVSKNNQSKTDAILNQYGD